MRNTFGNTVTLTLFGESHGPELGIVIDGLKPGTPIDEAFIAHQLSLRRPAGAISTARREPDPFRIVSGAFEGRACGTPLTLLIPNTDTRSRDYEATRALARPGHADYTAHVKYAGFEDYRGGGHFSGRITAALVAAGAVFIQALREKGILLATHVARCAGIDDAPLPMDPAVLQALNEKPFAVVDDGKGAEMQAAIEAAAADRDSVGGILETAVLNLPAGLGDPWFDSAESRLSHALFSIPGIKGVAFGDGFGLADLRGSQANDPFRMENGRVVSETNHNGGINGGITNGMPLTFTLAVKPTPSLARPQDTVNFLTGENAELCLQGRHDPAIIHRARVVVDSVTAFVLYDMVAQEGLL